MPTKLEQNQNDWSEEKSAKTFSDHLREIRAARGLRTTEEQYKDLGGKPKLRISISQFRAICAGTCYPNPHVFAAVFEVTLPTHRNDLIAAYLGSLLSEAGNCNEILEHYQTFSRPAPPTETADYFKETTQVITFSDEQLDLLTENTPAARTLNRAVYWHPSPVDRGGLPFKQKNSDGVDGLLGTGLVRLEGEEIRLASPAMKFPRPGEALPRSITKAIRRQRKYRDTYMQEDPDTSQVYKTGFLAMRRADVPLIMAQLEGTHRYILSYAPQCPDPTAGVAMVWEIWCRFLSPDEI